MDLCTALVIAFQVCSYHEAHLYANNQALRMRSHQVTVDDSRNSEKRKDEA